MANHGAREWYDDGIAEHYSAHGASYRNPAEPIVIEIVALALQRWPIDTRHVLDLCAGSGEFTRALLAARPDADIAGCDPFTFAAYERETHRPCERHSFEAIANGVLRGRSYALIGCSFAMHLCDASMLPQLSLELAQISTQLLILTPHKRPVLREDWGWTLAGELTHARVRARFYVSTLAPATLPGV